jgi:hypothetical protein
VGAAGEGGGGGGVGVFDTAKTTARLLDVRSPGMTACPSLWGSLPVLSPPALYLCVPVCHPACSDDPELLPLDQWVLNTEAHPLPIWGSHTEDRILKAAGITPLDL